jgi:hypothetical protein
MIVQYGKLPRLSHYDTQIGRKPSAITGANGAVIDAWHPRP